MFAGHWVANTIITIIIINAVTINIVIIINMTIRPAGVEHCRKQFQHFPCCDLKAGGIRFVSFFYFHFPLLQRSQLYRLRPKYLEAVQEQRPFLLRRPHQGRPRGPLLLHQGEEGSFVRVHLSLSLGGDKDGDDGQLDDNRNSSNFRDFLILVEPSKEL